MYPFGQPVLGLTHLDHLIQCGLKRDKIGIKILRPFFYYLLALLDFSKPCFCNNPAFCNERFTQDKVNIGQAFSCIT